MLCFMVNGLAAAKSVILLNSETRCSQSLFLRDRSFLNRREKIAHLVRLEIQQISRTQPFRNHQNMTYEKRDGRWLRVANISTSEPN